MNRIQTHRPTIRSAFVATALVLALGACGDDDEAATTTTEAVEATEPSTATTAPATTVAATTTEVPDTTTATSEQEPDTTAVDTPSTTSAPTTDAPTTTVAIDALQSVPGMASIEVTIDGVDPTRPNYSWAAPAGATSYQVAVQTDAGVPLWGWTGTETAVLHGGAERAENVEGPTLTGPSQVRVYAFDAVDLLIAVSAWTPVPGA